MKFGSHFSHFWSHFAPQDVPKSDFASIVEPFGSQDDPVDEMWFPGSSFSCNFVFQDHPETHNTTKQHTIHHTIPHNTHKQIPKARGGFSKQGRVRVEPSTQDPGEKSGP